MSLPGDAALPDEHELLTTFLAARDEPCPVCAYNLRDTRDRVCPECGAPLSLALASVDAAPGGWLLAVVSCALAAGFDLICSFLIVVFVGIAITRAGPPPGSAAARVVLALASLLIPGLASAGGLLWLLRRRRAWRLAPRVDRWRRGVAVFVVVTAAHVLIGSAWMLAILSP